MSAVGDLIPMPAPPRDLFRVNGFYPFEEGQKRLLFVVENAAFVEADPASWALAALLKDTPRVRRSELEAQLLAQFSAPEVAEALEAFARLEILVPADRPRAPADMVRLEPAAPLSSLVLHVAHDCNLRCGYCYADYGRYGDDFGMMTEDVALAHVDRFFDQLGERNGVYVTFFGGEPLMNMPVVYAAHARAKARAAAAGKQIAFGITTNATLLTPEIVAFFHQERFTVTVSIDGPPDVNDRLRPIEGGGGSYEKIMERVRGTGVDCVARVTLTKRATDIARIVRHLVAAGFKEVGVSPVAAGDPRFDLGPTELAKVLDGMRALADEFVDWAKQGKIFPFSNLRTVLEQIGAGDPRPLPCGAATALAAADNKGDLYACHRLVGNDRFKIGSLAGGIDGEKRNALLHDFHPRGRAPCQSCWARYLCGGGCHHIAWLQSEKGPAPWQLSADFCDFLRGWYRLGLYTYARIADEAPEMLGRLRGTRAACSQPSGL